MNDYLDRFSGLIGVPGWILSAFLIILGALLLELIYRIFIGHLANLAEKSGHMWDDAIVYAGRRPISLLIWWQGHGDGGACDRTAQRRAGLFE